MVRLSTQSSLVRECM